MHLHNQKIESIHVLGQVVYIMKYMLSCYPIFLGLEEVGCYHFTSQTFRTLSQGQGPPPGCISSCGGMYSHVGLTVSVDILKY